MLHLPTLSREVCQDRRAPPSLMRTSYLKLTASPPGMLGISPPMDSIFHHSPPNQITMSVQNHDRQDLHVNQEQTAHNGSGTAAPGSSGSDISSPNATIVMPQQSPVERSTSTLADDTRSPSVASTGQICR